jgi:four helix bundle protein
MTKDELQERILQFILRIIRLSQQLPQSAEAYVIKKQLIRAATSVGANHRAMRRARSGNEYFAKLSIVVEEADETLFWLELLIAAEIVPFSKLCLLLQESKELLAIFASTRKKHRSKKEE